MSIFNSLGSNYDFSFVLKSFFTFDGNSQKLKFFLEEKYKGKAILLYKGRGAIEMALNTLHLEEGSFVVINGFTCFAVFDAIKKAGFNIEYLDIDKGELNFSADTLKKAINKNPNIKVVIIQNTLGYPCDIKRISKICKKNNIYLIEDLAHSIGTVYEDGKDAGTVGDFVVLSFSQDKIIDGISGGALIKRTGVRTFHIEGGIDSNLPKMAFINQLIDKFYPVFTFIIRKTYSILIGKIIHEILKSLNLLSKPMDGGEGKYQLPNWYTNIIMSQFEEIDENLHHRKTIASIYAQFINPKILSSKITGKISTASNLRFPIFITKREDLIKYLAKHQIYVSDIWYDGPIAPKKYLKLSDYKQGGCPNSELASNAILNLPTHRNISEGMAKNISNLINEWLKY